MSAIALSPTSPTQSPADREPSLRIPLTQLKRGARAVVELGHLDDDESKLLAAMGLANESEVRVCRAGGMCIVQVEATRLGISASMAARILARPCECHGIGPDGAQATSPIATCAASDACR